MNPLVFVDECNVGLGVFASRDIKKGEAIFIFSGQIVSGSVAKLPEANAYALQIDVDTYIDPEQGLGRFINHSCQPNAGIIENNVVIALQDIPINTEVRFDYSTTMLERFWTLECACGVSQCRKVIEDFDLLPLALQQYYIALGIVPDFIIQQLNPTITAKTQSL
jgi:uncharacterized protein